ncbi:MAG: hypothetical protein Q9159_000572 [Coniocarpon cinnabarinum]
MSQQMVWKMTQPANNSEGLLTFIHDQPKLKLEIQLHPFDPQSEKQSLFHLKSTETENLHDFWQYHVVIEHGCLYIEHLPPNPSGILRSWGKHTKQLMSEKDRNELTFGVYHKLLPGFFHTFLPGGTEFDHVDIVTAQRDGACVIERKGLIGNKEKFGQVYRDSSEAYLSVSADEQTLVMCYLGILEAVRQKTIEIDSTGIEDAHHAVREGGLSSYEAKVHA